MGHAEGVEEVAEFAHLGTLLRERRIEMGLTQSEIAAKMTGLHVQIVSNWERGLCAPPVHCFHKVIDFLKLSRRKVEKAMLEDARAEIMARVYGPTHEGSKKKDQLPDGSDS